MTEKITWKKVFEDFKKRFPKKSLGVLGFRPYNYATILLIFPDRVHMLYNYDTKKLIKMNNDEVI